MISNHDVAAILERVSDLLGVQRANPFRVRAYRNAADRIRGMECPLLEVLERDGADGLEALPGVGPSLARLIEVLLRTGRVPLLDRLEGEICPEALFMTVPGLGEVSARRIHDELGLESLEELEIAAHDGRLDSVQGFGPRRVHALRETLTSMLGRASRVRGGGARAGGSGRPSRRGQRHSVGARESPRAEELLAIDREYRELADRDVLVRITPRRFNPEGERWLPVFHTMVRGWDITAMYSNTAMAHQIGRTHDWVVIYADLDGFEERYTVVTDRRGQLAGFRVVRGREGECADYYTRAGGDPPRSVDGEEPFLPGLAEAEDDRHYH